MENKGKPGMMLYFEDMRVILKVFNGEEFKELFTAMLDYAELGVVPELNGMTAAFFDLLRPKIDRDGEKYEQRRIHSRYMAYCRNTPENERMSEAEYAASLTATDSNCQLPPVADGYCRLPTTTKTTTETTAETETTTETETTAQTKPTPQREYVQGEGTRGRADRTSELEERKQRQIAMLRGEQ